MHPSLAALIMELAAPYLKENAQIIDPFCGVGTMLIERDIRVPAREKYGTDIFGEAIDGARENAALAGEQINFIHRDFFDFKHDYLFDEIVTNMPVRGKMTRSSSTVCMRNFSESINHSGKGGCDCNVYRRDWICEETAASSQGILFGRILYAE